MLRIPENTLRRAASKMRIGELAYYETLEAEFRITEAEKAAKKDAIESLQALLDRCTSQALRIASDANFAIPDEYKDAEQQMMKPLYDFQERRNTGS